MPMRTPNDHCLGDVSKPFCTYCGRENGELKSYDEVLAGMAGYLQGTQGLGEDAARQTAAMMMAHLPAWRQR